MTLYCITGNIEVKEWDQASLATFGPLESYPPRSEKGWDELDGELAALASTGTACRAPTAKTDGGSVGSSTDCSRSGLGGMLSAVEGGDGDFCVAGDDFVWVGVDTDSVVCGGAGETD
jgi:hypothetical protein